MVIAVAGRRIDAPDAEAPRFPLRNVPMVELQFDALFQREGATALVGSAACGSDLVALTVAGRRGMRRRVVLPFDRDRFRETSVVDRPGDWGPVYDRVLAELDATRDVVTLAGLGEGDEAYVAANEAILREAAVLAGEANHQVMAVLAWEGASRGSDDVTAAFADEARKYGWPVGQVTTL